MEVFNAPLKDLIIISLLTSLRTRARRNIATVPIVPDSVGLKKPVIIPPITMPKIMQTINASGITSEPFFPCCLFCLGSYCRLYSLPMPAMTAIKRAAIISEGTIPARKSLPMDCST